VSSSNPRRLVPRHWVRWLVAAAAVAALLAVGGPFVYIHFVESKAPAPFSLGKNTSSAQPVSSASPASSASSASAPLAGTWAVASGSEVGYRVQEVLFGQQHTAVGRTSGVTGHFTIQGTTVTGGTFTVAMATVTSDQSQRDAQFRGRIMDTSTYPTSVFNLTRAIALAPVPGSGVTKNFTVHGNLTLHGQTRPVTFQLEAQRGAGTIKLSSSIPVVFADWNIPNPSFAGLVTTQNHGVLEFLLNLSHT
jgi:polyisoprenoid-binding protein YceI